MGAEIGQEIISWVNLKDKFDEADLPTLVMIARIVGTKIPESVKETLVQVQKFDENM